MNTRTLTVPTHTIARHIAALIALVFAAVPLRAADPGPVVTPPQIRLFSELPLDPATANNPAVKAVITRPHIANFAAFGPECCDLKGSAERAAVYLKSLPPSRRALCLGGWVFYPLIVNGTKTWTGYENDAPKVNIIADFRTGSMRGIDWETRRLRLFAEALRKAGVRLSVVYADFEGGYTYWSDLTMPPEMVTAICADPGCRALFGGRLTAVLAKAGGLVPEFNTEHWREFVLAFNEHCQRIMLRSIRASIADSGLGAISDHVVNFGWSAPGSFQTYDINGWPDEGDNTIDAAGTSSLVLYPVAKTVNLRYPPAVLSKLPLWNNMIAALNNLRSRIGAGPAVPVITTCEWGAGGGVANELMLRHAIRLGCHTFDLFNPPDCQGKGQERRVAEIVLAEQAWLPERPLTGLQEIPLDADEIVTGGLVTTYAEFKRMVEAAAVPGIVEKMNAEGK